jgi:hypothetical protein
MPRHAKSTKTQRDERMVAGLMKHRQELAIIERHAGLESVEAVVARYQAHLDALQRVDATAAVWRTAVSQEENVEAQIKKLTRRMKNLLCGTYGEQSPTLLDFGIAPRKRAKIGVEKMRVTVEKRNATRKARHTMGKKQKKAVKG